MGTLTVLEWLSLFERELLLFAGTFFLLGALDELAIDILWLWMRLTGRRSRLRLRLSRDDVRNRRLSARAAVFIPAWQEEAVIAHTVAHALQSWPNDDFVIYVGCYRNDSRTLEAAMRGAGADRRVRLVVHDIEGPTTKADCLNRLYAAMQVDEARVGSAYRMVLLHDAEDMVDPAGLALLDKALDRADFVQLPVLPLPQSGRRLVGSHYCEEFAESHGKAMVVRDWLGTSLPGAGVGCAIDRGILRKLVEVEAAGPFSVDALTEDYELGIRIRDLGGTARFLRVRADDGTLIATRAYFPARLEDAVRQKSRWVHGIALQGWDRLGWSSGVAEIWMRLRDRRGPLAALVLACGYLFFGLSGVLMLLGEIGLARPWLNDPLLRALVIVNLVAFAWRVMWRFAFTTREYGLAQGFGAVLRIPLANVIAIMAGRRALAAYVRTLSGAKPAWDKTHHDAHPAIHWDFAQWDFAHRNLALPGDASGPAPATASATIKVGVL
jgi:adsorption protein B